MKLEVGKTYELANGEVRECTRMFGDNPLAVSTYGFGPFVVDGAFYHQDGTHGSGVCPLLNVIRCVDEEAVTDSSGCVMCDLGVCDDDPTLWRDMTPEQKGALLLAHHEGKVIEFWSASSECWVASSPGWMYGYAYRIKPEPEVETVVLYGRLTGSDKIFAAYQDDGDTHSITLTIRDGVVDPVAQVEEL